MMKNSNRLIQKEKILLQSIPDAVGAALAEQCARLEFLEIVNVDSSADLIVSGNPDVQPSVTPALHITFAAPQRLGIVLRRIGQALSAPTLHMGNMALYGGIFYAQEKTFHRADGAVTALTDREAEILTYLLRKTVGATREDMLKDIWRYQDGIDTHTLETHIYRLRQKIEISADTPETLITTETGYALRQKEKHEAQ